MDNGSEHTEPNNKYQTKDIIMKNWLVFETGEKWISFHSYCSFFVL